MSTSLGQNDAQLGHLITVTIFHFKTFNKAIVCMQRQIQVKKKNKKKNVCVRWKLIYYNMQHIPARISDCTPLKLKTLVMTKA